MQGTERQVHEIQSSFRSGKISRTSAKYKPLYIHSKTNCLRRSVLMGLFCLRVWPKIFNYNDVRYQSFHVVASPWQVICHHKATKATQKLLRCKKYPSSQRGVENTHPSLRAVTKRSLTITFSGITLLSSSLISVLRIWWVTQSYAHF
jgi:hypothetical protein